MYCNADISLFFHFIRISLCKPVELLLWNCYRKNLLLIHFYSVTKKRKSQRLNYHRTAKFSLQKVLSCAHNAFVYIFYIHMHSRYWIYFWSTRAKNCACVCVVTDWRCPLNFCGVNSFLSLQDGGIIPNTKQLTRACGIRCKLFCLNDEYTGQEHFCSRVTSRQ